VDINAALAADLHLLNDALIDSGIDLGESVQLMARDAKLAIPSYLGLSLTIAIDGTKTGFTALEDEADATEILSSVLLPLAGVLGTDSRPSVSVILYGARAGAFVDLAADLAWLTGRQLSEFVLDGHREVPAARDGLGTLRDASVINQAIGVLMAHGYTPEAAAHELDARARIAGTDRLAAANAVLATPGTLS
jgi:hypothetical protein